MLVIHKDNARLYELYRAFRNGDGSWNAESAALFHLDSNNVRPGGQPGWTSADAAGLPIFPGLVRYDEVFGPNFGGATVHTNVRAGYVGECPNVGKFISNLVFSLEMENEIMGAILNDGADPKAAATAWLKANPDAVTPWLDGVTTFDGGDAAAAVKSALGA